MLRLFALAALLASAAPVPAADWILATTQERVASGGVFQVDVVNLAGEPLPERIELRVRGDRLGRTLSAHAVGPASGPRRTYGGTLPAQLEGPVTLALADRPSSVLVLIAGRRPDAVRDLVARRPAPAAAEVPRPEPPPIAEHEPMYFALGTRGGTSARFQLSFKYRMFDQTSGLGRDAPWLAGLYFGYTQNALWDLSSESKPFRDTSYKPSLFWQWDRPDEKTWIDGLRLGYEHESNGKDGTRSRSIDTVFVHPAWRWPLAQGASFELAPKLYAYLDKQDNPDIQRYRGYADWRAHYASGGAWSLGATTRLGTAGKGSFLAEYSVRARALAFGPVGGYFYVQYFDGYGEDILGYKEHRRSQLRLGVAIVP